MMICRRRQRFFPSVARSGGQLLAFAEPFAPRVWALEGATGTGALLAQQLVGAGETVLDVPPKLSARDRLLDTGAATRPTPMMLVRPRSWPCATRSSES